MRLFVKNNNKKQKVVFLGDTLLNNEPLGIQRFAYEILLQLDNIKTMYDIELLIPRNVDCEIQLNNIRIVRFGSYKFPFLWRQLFFPFYCLRENALSVDFTLGLGLFNKGIVGIFDCIYEKYPADFITKKDKLKRFSYLIRTKIVINQSKKIITVSEFSKKEIVEQYNVNPSRIEVIPCGWQHYKRIIPDMSILEKINVHNNQFYFSLGSGLPHKNFEWIIRAAINNPECCFVVTGTDRLSNYEGNLNVEDITNIIFTGYLSDSEVKGLMIGCKMFIHPSVYEGFGIPPLEALACGTNAIVSDSTCLPEIFGNFVLYLNPYDESPIMNYFIGVKEEDKSSILSKYDWKDSAMKVDRIIREALS